MPSDMYTSYMNEAEGSSQQEEKVKTNGYIMLDSSVLVAAFHTQHPHFEASFQLLKSLPKKERIATCHSIAETFRVLTSLPAPFRTTAEDARLYLTSLDSRIRWLDMDSTIYALAIERMIARKLIGGKIYDSIILQTALNARAKHLYTWNIKDFNALAGNENIHIIRPDQVI